MMSMQRWSVKKVGIAYNAVSPMQNGGAWYVNAPTALNTCKDVVTSGGLEYSSGMTLAQARRAAARMNAKSKKAHRAAARLTTKEQRRADRAAGYEFS